MFRLLLIGRTEDIAREESLWAVSEEDKGEFYEKRYEISGRTVSVRVFPIWVGQKGRKPTGDGLLIVAKNPGDLQAIDECIAPYQNMPIKFILYDGAPEQPDFEMKWGAKPLPKGTSLEFVDKLITANNDFVKQIGKVFKDVDKEGKGKLNLEEAKVMARDLADKSFKNMDKLEEILSELSKAKDGSVSLDDIVECWKTGGRGNASKVGMMIKNMIENHPVIQKVLEPLKELQISSQLDKMMEASFEINANKVTSPRIFLELSWMTGGNFLNSEFQKFASAIDLGNYDPFVGIALGVKDPKDDSVKMQELIKTIVMIGTSVDAKLKEILSYMEIRYGVTSTQAMACILPSDKGMAAIDPIISLMNLLSSTVVSGQFMTARAAFSADLADLVTRDEPAHDILLDGASIFMNAKVHSDVHKNLTKVMIASGLTEMLPEEVVPLLAPLAMLSDLHKSSKGELEFDVNQTVKQALNDLIDEDDLKMSLKTFKESIAEEAKEKMASNPLANKAYNFFRDSVTSIEIFVYLIGTLGVKIKVDLPGLSTAISL